MTTQLPPGSGIRGNGHVVDLHLALVDICNIVESGRGFNGVVVIKLTFTGSSATRCSFVHDFGCGIEMVWYCIIEFVSS